MRGRTKELIAAGLVLVFMLIAAASSSTDDPKKEGGSSSGTTTPTQSQEMKFALKETAVFENLKITANEIKTSQGSQYNKPGEGKVFVGVLFTIENVSSEDQALSTLLLFDAYADDVKCEFSMGASVAFDEGTLDGKLSPGKKMVGYYAVEVPKGTAKLEFEVKSSWLGASKAVFEIDMPK